MPRTLTDKVILCNYFITLDSDLYDQAAKLEEYKEHWCIRFGALHTSMATLKCHGKYKEGGGINLAF